MPHIETPEGIRIRYDERGTGRPLVLAHGFGVSLEMWMPQMHALSQQYRLITWDARGHGGSSAPGHPEAYTMPLLAQDLRYLLEGLDAVAGAVIGGMSFGGQIALQYAADYPADTYALVLSDSTTRGNEPPRDPRLAADAWGVAGDPGLEGCLHAMAGRPDLTAILPSLPMPALVLYGQHDEMIEGGVQRLVDGLSRRRVTVLGDCFHGTSGQRPQAWNDAVLRFLADVTANAPLGDEEFV